MYTTGDDLNSNFAAIVVAHVCRPTPSPLFFLLGCDNTLELFLWWVDLGHSNVLT